MHAQDQATSSRLRRSKKPAGRTGVRNRILALLFLVFVTLTAYLNAWPHPLQIYHPVFSVNTWLALVLQLVLLGLAIMGFVQKRYELAVKTERNPALMEYRKAYMLTKLYPSDQSRLLDAKTHLEQALQTQTQLIPARQLLEQLNRILGNG